jgi:hypothetical protein
MWRLLLGLVVGFALGGVGWHVANAQRDLADFAVVIEPEENGAKLSCIRGCAWIDLSFGCDAGECSAQVDHYGVGPVEAR